MAVAALPVMMAVLWKHSFLPLEATPLDMGRYFAVALDMMLDGLCAKEAA